MISRTNAHRFMDETKASGYVVVTAEVLPRDLARTRAAMRDLCLPGQSRLHFSRERHARRHAIADAIARSSARVDVYDALDHPRQWDAREACLRRIVQDMADGGSQRLVVERDDALLRVDQLALYDAVRRAGAQDHLTYEHLPARSEPLLWIADAAAWCWVHGADWRRRLGGAVRSVTTI